MAWEATYLLSPIVLVLLAPGSWAQDTDVRQAVEGRTVSVDCPYAPGQRFKKKVWCRETSAEICQILVSSPSLVAQQPKYSMRDHPESNFFTVTMTAVTRRDSGFYFCGITENGGRISIFRTIRLVVSEDSPYLSTMSIVPTTSTTNAPTLIATKYPTRARTRTQPFPKSTTVVSSPNPGVTLPTVTRVSISSIVVLVVCGLFSKTLIFTVLFAVTKRSCGGQT